MDKNELIDIRDVVIDESLSVPERIKSFYEQIKNPSMFLCGKLVISLEFNEEGMTFEECIRSNLKTF